MWSKAGCDRGLLVAQLPLSFGQTFLCSIRGAAGGDAELSQARFYLTLMMRSADLMVFTATKGSPKRAQERCFLKSTFLEPSLTSRLPFNLVAFWFFSDRNLNVVSLCVSQRILVTVHAYVLVSRIIFLLINYIGPFSQKWKILKWKNSESVSLS